MEGINENTTTCACSSLAGLLVVPVTLWYVTHLVCYVSIFSTERERERGRGDKGRECTGVI